MRSWTQRGSDAAQRLGDVLGVRDGTRVEMDGTTERPRWSPPSLRAFALVLAGVLAVAAWWWWTGRPRELITAPTVLSSGMAMAITATPSSGAPPQSSVVVHVIGKVMHPGLVHLQPGSRVADAVAAAGGFTDPQAQSTVNLARMLIDGEQIAGGVTPPGGASASAISLSTATPEQLDSLPGIGPVLASRIVSWRTAHGPFRTVAQLGDVPGIGPSLLSQLTGSVQP